ncbi:MAG: tetratricopeptide repeat protein [Syntrophobacteraceae bacterium]
MRTAMRDTLIICLLLFLAACGASPETKKARHFENGDKFLEQKQYKEAATEYGNVLKIDPNNKNAYKKLASISLLTGELGKSLSFLLRARGVDPEDIEVRLQIARLQLAADRLKESRAEVEFILEKDPQNAEAWGLLADVARTPADVADAIARFKELQPSPANLPKYNLALGQLYLKKGEFRNAENSFLEALSGDSNFVEAHLGLGDLAAIRKDYRAAEQEYRAAADLVPGVTPVHMRLADFHLFMRNPDQARQVLTSALERNPNYVPALHRMARIALGEQNLDGCAKYLDLILQKDPSNLDAQITRGQLLLARNEPVEAEKLLVEITRANPELPFPKFLLGLAYMGKGDLVNARTSLKSAVEMDPNLTDAAFRLSEVYVRSGLYRPAYELLLELSAKDTGNMEVFVFLSEAARSPAEITAAVKRMEGVEFHFRENSRFNLALASLYLKSNEIEKAEQHLKRVLAKEPDSVDAHALMGQLLMTRKDPKQAEAELRKAAESSSGASGAQVLLAEFYYGNNKKAEAKKILTDILAKSPDFFPASFSLAKMAFEERDHAEATRLLGTVLKSNPSYLDALLLRAQVNLAQNKSTEASQDLEQALVINPRSYFAHYLTGIVMLQMGNAARAKASFNEVLRLEPGFLDPRIRLAELDLAAGAFEQAITNLEYVLDKGRKEPAIYLLLGSAYIGGKDPAKAEGVLRNYLKSAPLDPNAKHMLGLALTAQGKHEEAAGYFEDALKMLPESVPALTQLVFIDLRNNNRDQALRRVTKQLELSQPSGFYQLLGKVHLMRGEYDQAEKAYLKAIELDPGVVFYYLELIQVYNASKRYDQAALKLEEATKRDPKNIATLMLAGVFHEQRNNIPKAREAYEAVLSINPGFAAAANNLAYIYCEYTGDAEKAVKLARTAKDGAPNDPNIADTLGWALYKNGNFDWALTYLQESAAKIPENAEVQFHLGMTQYQLGNMEEAKKALTRALEIKPDFRGAPEAQKILIELQK